MRNSFFIYNLIVFNCHRNSNDIIQIRLGHSRGFMRKLIHCIWLGMYTFRSLICFTNLFESFDKMNRGWYTVTVSIAKHDLISDYYSTLNLIFVQIVRDQTNPTDSSVKTPWNRHLKIIIKKIKVMKYHRLLDND